MFIHYTVRYPNNFYEGYRHSILTVGLNEQIHKQMQGQKFLEVSYAVLDGLDRAITIENLKALLNRIADNRPDVKLTFFGNSNNEAWFELN